MKNRGEKLTKIYWFIGQCHMLIYIHIIGDTKGRKENGGKIQRNIEIIKAKVSSVCIKVSIYKSKNLDKPKKNNIY